MKLIRFGEPGRERPGLIVDGGRRIDVSGFGADYDEAFFGSGGLERLARWLAKENPPTVPDGVRLGPPLVRPSKIVCVGLNYRDHARETGQAIPAEPVLFFKATTALAGPNDDVVIPRAAPRPTGRWSLRLSSGAARATSSRTPPWPTWRATCCTTTTRSGPSSSSGGGSGSRGRAAIHSRPSAPFSRRPTRSP